MNPHLDINRKHAEILGQWGTGFQHLTRALTLLARHSKALPLQNIVGKSYTLEESNEALADVEALQGDEGADYAVGGQGGWGPPQPTTNRQTGTPEGRWPPGSGLPPV